MTSTYTNSSTFTRTHAAYLASKIAADLKQFHIFYGEPDDVQISKYIEEVILYLLAGYLDSVDYGFKKNGKWIVVTKYSALYGVLSGTDQRAGGIPSYLSATGAIWASYLRTNHTFTLLSQEEKNRFYQLLPFQRTGAPEAGYHNGQWVEDKSYHNGGTSLNRRVFRPDQS